MSTKALGPFTVGEDGFTIGAFFTIDNPFQGQGRNKWKALVRNNTVYDLMISASTYTTWLGPDEQDYYEFEEGVQSFAMIPVVTQPVPASIFEGDVKVTAFDQSSDYDGQFPTALAPQVVLYESGPSQKLGSFTAPTSSTTSETFPVDSWVHTIFVMVDNPGGSANAQFTLKVTGSSGFVYFDGVISLLLNDGSELVTIPWIFVNDQTVTVEVTQGITGLSLHVVVVESADVYPTLNLNGVPYTLVARGNVFVQNVTAGAVIGPSLTASRGVMLEAESTNADSVWYGYDNTVTVGGGVELTPGASHILPLQNADDVWIVGHAGDKLIFNAL